jgi:predicted nucleotidyltransferase
MTLSVFPGHDALAAICRRYHNRRLSLFGSTLKGSDRPDSDVDLWWTSSQVPNQVS